MHARDDFSTFPTHNFPYNQPPYIRQTTDDFNPGSCSGRCDTKGHNRQLPCQCNARCIDFADCCMDYEAKCLTCRERQCGDDFKPDLPCQCNGACKKHEDCCNDFDQTCDGMYLNPLIMYESSFEITINSYKVNFKHNKCIK